MLKKRTKAGQIYLTRTCCNFAKQSNSKLLLPGQSLVLVLQTTAIHSPVTSLVSTSSAYKMN